MDARHWWLVNRVQETFQFGTNDSPLLYEQFLSDVSHMREINKFLSAEDSRLLIFYDAFSQDSPTSRELYVITELLPSSPVYRDSNVAVVFFRPEVVTEELDLATLKQDVMCLELNLTNLNAMIALISELYLPMVDQEAKMHPNIPSERVDVYRKELNGRMAELNSQLQKTEPQINILASQHLNLLRDPQWKNSTLLQDICTTTLQDWLSTIHSHLTDIIDTPYMDTEKLSSPLEELRKWTARQKLFLSILKQMRGSEATTTVKIASAVKPELANAWSRIEAQVILANHVVKNKLSFLNYFNKFFSPILSDCSSVKCLNTKLTELNSDRDYLTNFKLPTQPGYMGYIYYKLVCEVIRISTGFLQVEYVKFTGQANSNSWFFLNTKDKYPGFYLIIDEILRMEEYLIHHFGLLEERDLFRKVSSPSVKRESGSLHDFATNPVEDQEAFLEFSSKDTLLSPLISFTKHLRLLNTLADGIHKLSLLSNQLVSYHSSTGVEWINNPIVLATEDGGTEPTLELDPEYIQESPSLSSRKKRPIGSGKMGTLLEVDEDTPQTISLPSPLDSPSGGSSESSLTDANNSIRIYSNFSRQIQTWLNENLQFANDNFAEGWKFLFEPTQSQYDLFNELLNQIRESFEILNLNIGAMFDEITDSQFCLIEQLKLVHIFSGWADTEKADQFRKRYVTSAFTQFEDKMISLEKKFLEHKTIPCRLIDISSVSESIRWSRLLLGKLEEPMRELSKYESILKNPENFENFKKYETFRSDLRQYEKVWFKFSLDAVKEISKQQQNKLLLLPQEGELILINLNPIIFAAIRELKSLTKLGINLPPKTTELIFNEQRLKRSFDTLTQLKYDFTKIYSKLPEHLISLYEPNVKLFLKSLQHGWTHLTWNSINLDIFFEGASRELSKLRTSVLEVLDDITQAEKAFQTNMQSLPTLLSSVVTTESSLTIDQYQSLITSFISTAKSRLDNTMQSFHSVICRSFLKIRDCYAEYESHSKHELFEIFNLKLDDTSLLFVGLKYFLQHYVYWSQDIVANWITSQFKQFSSIIPSSLCHPHQLDKLEKVLSDLHIEPTSPSLPILHKFITASDFNKFVKLFTKNKLRISCEFIYEVPFVISAPSYESISEIVLTCFDQLVSLSSLTNTRLLVESEKISLINAKLCQDANCFRSEIESRLMELSLPLRHLFNFFQNFNSIWRGELHQSYEQVRTHSDYLHLSANIVHSLFDILVYLRAMPSNFNIGILKVSLAPIQMSLCTLIELWKNKFSAFLLDSFETMLNNAIEEREKFYTLLDKKVEDISDLDTVLKNLRYVFNLEFSIESTFYQIDSSYQLLDSYEVSIKRAYLDEVNALRTNWQSILTLAHDLQEHYLEKNKLMYERDIEKAVKSFQIQTIQLSNEFDAKGPYVPGIDPKTAMSRLNTFSEKFQEFFEKKELLSSLQSTYFMPISTYSDLDRVGDEIEILKQLYALYENFCNFEKEIQSQAWSHIQFDQCQKQVLQFNETFLLLNPSLCKWEAYQNIHGKINFSLEVIPILKKLQDPTIKNRHWLQLMALESKSLPVNYQIVTLDKILQLNPVQNASSINEICKKASEEFEVEKKLNTISFEWSDQVFTLIYAQEGIPYVCLDSISKLHQLLNNHYVILTLILNSPSISHFLDIGRKLSAQVKSIEQFLNNLTYSQTLAFQLENVFLNKGDFSDSAIFDDSQIHFVTAFNKWKKFLKKIDQNSIVSCSCVDDQLSDQLLSIIKEFETCKFSLDEFIDVLRTSFPFLYFLSDNDILDMLKDHSNPDALVPHIKQFFPELSRFIYKTKSRKSSISSAKSEKSETVTKYIGGFISTIGEEIDFERWIPICRDSYHTLNEVILETRNTLQVKFSDLLRESKMKKVPNAEYELFIIEWQSIPLQVASVYLHSIWTKNVEEAIINFRSHKNALTEATKIFIGYVHRLQELVTNPHATRSSSYLRNKLEYIVFFALWLKDINDELADRKLRDISDFEWQKFVRMYYHCTPLLNDKSSEVVTANSNTPYNLTLRSLFTDIQYGFDYVGHSTPNIFFSSSTRTVHLIYLAILEQRHAQFKTDLPFEFIHSAKEFARFHGKNLMHLRVQENLSRKGMSSYLLGTLLSGYWGLVTGWDNMSVECQSIFTSIISQLHGRIFPSDSDRTFRKDSSILLLTSNLGHFLAPNLRPYFKSCSYLAPNDHYVLRTYCHARGIKSPKQLVDKMLWLRDILPSLYPETSHVKFTIPFFISLLKQCSADKIKAKSLSRSSSVCEYDVRQSHSRRVNFKNLKQLPQPRSTVGNLFNLQSRDFSSTPVALKDQTIIASYLIDTCLPRFQVEIRPKFLALLDQVFGTSFSTNLSDSLIIPNFNTIFIRVCNDLEIIPSNTLEQQIKDIHRAANMFPGVILYGLPGTGKSTAFKVFINYLRNITGDITNDNIARFKQHKMYHIYPRTLYSSRSLIGREDERLRWRDGVIPQAIMHAHKDPNCLVWIIFDDEIIEPQFFEFLSTCIFAGSLALSNGDNLSITNNVRFVFETLCLKSFSLSLLNLFQMIYFSKYSITLSSFTSISIQKHPPMLHKVIKQVLLNTIETFLKDHLVKYPNVNELNMIGLYKTFFNYFDQLIDNCTSLPIQSEPDNTCVIERFALFALTWSFGIHVEETKWSSFTQDLYSLSDSLPDLEPGYTIYDYIISSSGDWDTVQMLHSDSPIPYSITCDGDIMAQCANFSKVNMLIELTSSKRPIMLIGPHSTGKSSLMKFNLYSNVYQDLTQDVSHEAINANTTISSLYDSLYLRLECRFLDTYGPPNSHKLNLFIDDLHIGQSEKDGNSPILEFIRCLLEQKGLFSKEFPTKWLTIEDVHTVCAMTTYRSYTWMESRLSQHFNVIRLVPEAITQDTLSNLLDAFTQPEGMTRYSPDVLGTITNTARTLFQYIQSIFIPTILPGRHHYSFSLKDLSLIFHGFRVCADELLERESEVFNLFYHNANRVFSAQFSNLSDLESFRTLVKKLFDFDMANSEFISCKTEFKDLPYFTTLVEEQKPSTANVLKHAIELNTNIIIHSCPVLENLVASGTRLHNQHNEKYSDRPCTSMLALSDIKQLDYLNFILSLPRSNVLFIGSNKKKLFDIAKLAYFASGFEHLDLALSNEQSFIDGIKAAIRQAVLGSKSVGFILTDNQLEIGCVKELFNTYLVTGHLDHVFSYDELNSLVNSVEPIYKRSYASTYTDPRQYFNVQIQKNLKVILCIGIHNPLLKDSAGFPGLIKGCYVSVYRDWCGTSVNKDIIELVSRSESKMPITTIYSDFPISEILDISTSLHNMFLQEDRELYFLEHPSNFSNNSIEILDSINVKSPQPKPNAPNTLSQLFFEENVKFAQNSGKFKKSRMYFSGSSLQTFIKLIFTIYINEAKNTDRKLKGLKKCIETRDKMQKMYNNLLEEISRIESCINEKNSECESLLQELSQVSCKIEAVKVFSSHSEYSILRATLDSLRSQDETDVEMLDFEDDKQLIIQLLENETHLKQESIDKLTQVQYERIDVLKVKQKDLLKLIEEAEAEVKSSFCKITRFTVEHVKTLHFPPKHVLTVLETLVYILRKQIRTASIVLPKPDVSLLDSSVEICHTQDAQMLPIQPKGRQHLGRSGYLSSTRGNPDAWNAVQQAIGQDSQKFLDSISSMSWKFGLDPDVIHCIEKSIATSRNSQNPKTVSALITVQSAKHAADGVGIICAYIIALTEYSYVYKQHCVLEDEIYKLHQGIDKLNQQLISSDIKLPVLKYERSYLNQEQIDEYQTDALEVEIKELEERFHKAVFEQHELKQEFSKLKTFAKSLSDILQSTEALENSWNTSLESLFDKEIMIYYSIATSILLTYLGSIPPKLRKSLFVHSFNKMSANLDEEKQSLLSYESFRDFLRQTINWNLDLTKIPNDYYVEENFCIILNPYLPKYPLIVDPYSIFLCWMKDQDDVTSISYDSNDLLQILETQSKQAKKFVIYDVNVNDLSSKEFIMKILKFKSANSCFTIKSTIPVKDITNSSFQLFLVTSLNQDIPYKLLPYVTPVLFTATRQGFSKDLGRVCLSVFESERFVEMRKNEEKLASSRATIKSVENELTTALCMSFEIENLVSKCKTITSLSATYQANMELYQSSKKQQQIILLTNSSIFDGGEIAAIVFDILRCLSSLDISYQICYANFKQFLKGISKGLERVDPKKIPQIILHMSYSYLSRSLSEDNRVHFALMLALEYEIYEKRAKRSEAEMLFSPLTQVKQSSKKPFDWMQERQWDNLNAMGQSVRTIQEVVDRMARDGRATQWRTFCEHDSPEEQEFPDGLSSTLSPLERLLILKCVKQDTLKNSIMKFIEQSLGLDLNRGMTLDYKVLVNIATPRTPILVLSNHPSNITLFTHNLIKHCNPKIEMRCLNGDSSEDISDIFDAINNAASQGNWVFIQNIDLNPSLMKLLTIYLDSITNCDESFRLWLSSYPTATFDLVFMHRCIRLCLGIPFEPKNGAIRCLEILHYNESLINIAKSEWTPLLHSLIMIHLTCRYRAMLYPGSWAQSYRWSIDSLTRSLKLVLLEIEQCSNTMLTFSQQNKPFSWCCVKYMIGELTYGSGLELTLDQELLNGLIEFWLNPNAIKPGYEFPRCQYKAPTVFHRTSPKPKDLIQGFLNETSQVIINSPEICGFYNKILSSFHDKIVDQTKILNDTLKVFRPEVDELVCIVKEPRPPVHIPLRRRQSSIADTAKRIASLVRVVDKSPSSFTIMPTSITTPSPFSVTPLRGIKELDIQAKCSLLLANLPQIVSVNHLITICEQDANQFLKNFYIQELKAWVKCFQVLRCDIFNIQQYLVFSKRVGVLPTLLEMIKDINDNKIPSKWQTAVGPSAPPQSQTFSVWIEHIMKRYIYLHDLIENGNPSSYNLGYVFYPGLLLASFCLLKPKHDNLNFEKSCLIGEITSKEKEHVRDPPSEGVYASEICVNGCLWEKSTGDFYDSPSKSNNTILPLVQITRFPAGQLHLRKESIRGPHLYFCPVYRNQDKKEVFFHLKIQHNDIPRIRWMTRGLTCTLQHY